MDQYLLGSLTGIASATAGAYAVHYFTEKRILKEKKLNVLEGLQGNLKMMVEYATLLTQAHYQCNYFRKANEIKPDEEARKLLVKFVDDVSRIVEKMIDQKGEMSKNLFLYRLYFGKDDPLFNLIKEIQWNDVKKFEYQFEIVNLDTLNREHKKNLENVFSLTHELVGKKVDEITLHLEMKAKEN
jgi:hypothetical protein